MKHVPLARSESPCIRLLALLFQHREHLSLIEIADLPRGSLVACGHVLRRVKHVLQLLIELDVVLVVEVRVQVPYLILAQLQVLLQGALGPEPVVEVTNLHILVDERDDLHVILAPVLIHVLDLDLDYL